jgi:hypothetical protein
MSTVTSFPDIWKDTVVVGPIPVELFKRISNDSTSLNRVVSSASVLICVGVSENDFIYFAIVVAYS